MNTCNWFVVVVIGIGLCFGLSSCWEKKEAAVPTKRQGFVVINVLDESLYNDCHIKGSINVPFEKLDTCVDLIDTSAEVVVYCSNYACTASDYARKRLNELGFTHVYVYEGGIAEWYQKGLPVDGPSQQNYLMIPVTKMTEHNEGDTQIIDAHTLVQKMGLVVAA